MVGLLEGKIAVYIQIVLLARPSLTSETSIMSQRTSVIYPVTEWSSSIN